MDRDAVTQIVEALREKLARGGEFPDAECEMASKVLEAQHMKDLLDNHMSVRALLPDNLAHEAILHFIAHLMVSSFLAGRDSATAAKEVDWLERHIS